MFCAPEAANVFPGKAEGKIAVETPYITYRFPKVYNYTKCQGKHQNKKKLETTICFITRFTIAS